MYGLSFASELHSLCPIKTTLIPIGCYNSQHSSTDYDNSWQKCCEDSKLSNDNIISRITYVMSLQYLGKHEHDLNMTYTHDQQSTQR